MCAERTSSACLGQAVWLGNIILKPKEFYKMNEKTGILEEIRQWLERCPSCKQIWLIFNRKDGDRHQCKGCRHNFTLGEGKVEKLRSSVAGGPALDISGA